MDAAALRAAVPRPRARRVPQRGHGRAGAARRRGGRGARRSSRAGRRVAPGALRAAARACTTTARGLRRLLGCAARRRRADDLHERGHRRVLARHGPRARRRDRHLRRGAPRPASGRSTAARASAGRREGGPVRRSSPTPSGRGPPLVACSHVSWVDGARRARRARGGRRVPVAARRRAGRRRGAARHRPARLRRLRRARARSGCAAPTAPGCSTSRPSFRDRLRAIAPTYMSFGRLAPGLDTPLKADAAPLRHAGAGARDVAFALAALERARAPRLAGRARARGPRSPPRSPSGSPSAGATSPRGRRRRSSPGRTADPAPPATRSPPRA